MISYENIFIGASYPPLSPKSLRRSGRVTTQQSSVSGGINDAPPSSQKEVTYSSSKNNFSRVNTHTTLYLLV